MRAFGVMTIDRNVDATSDALGGTTETGRIAAVDSVIDETTRNACVQAVFDDRVRRGKTQDRNRRIAACASSP